MTVKRLFRIASTQSKYVPGVEASSGFGGLYAVYNKKCLPAAAREELEWEARIEARLAVELAVSFGFASLSPRP